MILKQGHKYRAMPHDGKVIRRIYRGGRCYYKDSPYSLAATQALKAAFPQYWTAIRDYGVAHPQLVPFINEDPMNAVGIGQFFTNAELQAVADAQLIATKKLDDGSCWVRILHHDTNGGVRIFKSAIEAEYNPVEEMYSVLKYIGKWQYDGKYEFLAEEYMTQGATAHTDHRWSQTSNPYETTRATGFVNISNTQYGIGNFYKEYGKSTLLSYRNTGNLQNWFAAVGCMENWNGGIPPFDDKAKIANKGTLDLWIRLS